MIGNLWEWTADWWQAGYEGDSFSDGAAITAWPASYGDGQDMTWNLGGRAVVSGDYQTGTPAIALRGGALDYGAQAGTFAIDLNSAPTYGARTVGFRCALTWGGGGGE